MSKLGEFLKQYRESHKLSLREFGTMCGLSHTHIDSIEKGIDFRTGKPVRVTNETIQQLARATHSDPAHLFRLSIGDDDERLDTSDISGLYLSYAKEAQDNGILPEDIKLAIETIKRLRGQ